jgi:hypothetical protein
MLCILAFIIFLILFPILGFFPEYRELFRKSWVCMSKKVTMKPCDINLCEELKGKLLSKMFFRFPRFTRFLDRTFAFWAFLFVVLNIWSLGYVLIAGLNLYVYDTCSPNDEKGCALSGDSCSVPVSRLNFVEAVEQNAIGEWAAQPFVQLGETISRVPARWQTWDADNYLAPKPTFYNFNEGNPTAVEIIDPNCPSCKQLWSNIKTANFTDRHNLSYVLYPIPSQSTSNGFRFKNSDFTSRILEATKRLEPASPVNTQIPADWQLLDKIFNHPDPDRQFNFGYVWEPESTEAKQAIEESLTEIGYNQDEIDQLYVIAKSEEVTIDLATQKDIVENQVQTIKIPTIIFDGRRFDRVVEVDKLR